MKKLLKNLLLTLIVVSLITSGLVIPAFADEKTGGEAVQEDREVGSHETPEGAWLPSGENSDITYAVWESESLYLAGEEPISVSRSAVLEPVASGFVRTYAENLSLALGALQVSENGALTIDLGGVTTLLLNNYTKVLKGASLTVKNGTFINRSQIDYITDSKIRWENLKITVSSNTALFVRNTGAVIDEYVGCEISISEKNTYALMNNSSTSGKSTTRFSDTVIYAEGDRADALFAIYQYSNVNFEIKLEDASSVIGNVPSYVLLNERSDTNDFSKQAQSIIFEEGCFFSAGASNIYDYMINAYDGDTLLPTATVTGSSTSKNLTVTVTSRGSIAEAVGEIVFAERGDLLELTVDRTGVKPPVGSYVIPNGAYVPSNDAVTYAVFASEDDFLSGASPISEYTDAALSSLNITQDGVGYVHVYKSISSSDTIVVNKKAHITVNLGGNSVSDFGGINLKSDKSASLTLKNGYVICQYQLQPGTMSNLVFENLHFINTNSTFLYGASQDSFTIRDSKIELNAAASHIFLSGNINSDSEITSRLTFENTDLIINGAVNSTYGLFRIYDNLYAVPKWEIRFDSESSVIGNIDKWVTLVGNFSQNEVNGYGGGRNDFGGNTQYIIFEDGCTFSEGAIPDFKYDYVGEGATDSKTGADATVSGAMLSMLATLTGGDTGALTYEFVKDGENYVLSVDGGSIVDPDPDPTPDPEPDPTPDPEPDPVYSVYSSEESYLAGDEPISTSTSTVISGVAGGYVLLHKNAELTKDGLGSLAAMRITIDLGTNTLTFASGRIMGAAYFIIKNGSFLHNNQLDIDAGATLIFKNVNYTVNYTAATFYRNTGAALLRFDSCTINWNTDKPLTLMNAPKGVERCSLEFINTDINVNKELSSSLIQISESHYLWGFDANYTVLFDKDSSVSGRVDSYVRLNEYLAGTTVYGFGDKTQHVWFEEGFSYTQDAEPSFEYTLSAYDKDTLALKDPVVMGATHESANCTVSIVKPGTTEPITDRLFAISDGEFYSVLGEIPEEAAWIEDNGSKIITLGAKKTLEGAPGYVILASEIKALDDGTVLHLLSDLTVYNDTELTLEGDITIELSRHTLTLSDSIYVTGSLTVSDGYITSSAEALFIPDSEGASVTVSDVNATAEIFIIFNTRAVSNVNIKDSSITASQFIDSWMGAYAEIFISETYLTSSSVRGDGDIRISCGEGETLCSLSGGKFRARVTRVDAPMKANLTLNSDFFLNFYIPEDTALISFSVGGVKYNISEIEKTVMIGGKKYYVITTDAIMPSNAAEVLTYDVTLTKDGIVHEATLGYSILDYVEALLSTDYSVYAKELAVSAIEYVNAAYRYTGRTSSELDDLRECEAYIKYTPDMVECKPVGTDHSGAKDAVKSVQLNLGSTMKMRINLVDGYTGTLAVSGEYYEVVDGKVGELTYVEISLPAHRLYDEFFVFSVASGAGTYMIADYVYNVVSDAKTDDKTRELLLTFYSYLAYADRYEEHANVN